LKQWIKSGIKKKTWQGFINSGVYFWSKIENIQHFDSILQFIYIIAVYIKHSSLNSIESIDTDIYLIFFEQKKWIGLIVWGKFIKIWTHENSHNKTSVKM